MCKAHKHDLILAGVFFVVLIGVGVYFFMNALTGTKAAPARQLVEQQIVECYKKRKPDICPETPPVGIGATDENLKICGLCYSKCMICIAAKRFGGGESCNAKCVQDDETPKPSEEPTPKTSPTPLP